MVRGPRGGRYMASKRWVLAALVCFLLLVQPADGVEVLTRSFFLKVDTSIRFLFPFPLAVRRCRPLPRHKIKMNLNTIPLDVLCVWVRARTPYTRVRF